MKPYPRHPNVVTTAHFVLVQGCHHAIPSTPVVHHLGLTKPLATAQSSLLRWRVVSIRKIPISLHQQILSSLVAILASADENVLGARRRLEWISAPDDDIPFATGLQRADSIRDAKHLRRSERHCPECILP